MNVMEQLVQIGSALNLPQHRARRFIPPRGTGERVVSSVLTPRMLDLAPLLVRGMRLKDIGVSMGISEGRVKVLAFSMYQRVNVAGRWEFVNWWNVSGLDTSAARVFAGDGSDVVKMGAFE